MDKCMTCRLRHDCNGFFQFSCEMRDYKSCVQDEEILKKIGEQMFGDKFREKEKEYQTKIAQLEKIIQEHEKQDGNHEVGKRYIELYVTDEFKKLKRKDDLEGYAFPYDEHDVVLRLFGDKYMFCVYNIKKGETILTIDVNMVAAIEYDNTL